jgi:membrane-bound ClpP family serine protease
MGPEAAFLLIGGIGLALVVLSLFVGDFFEGLFDFEHFELGDGLLSTPVIGAFLAAFGAGGVLLLRLSALSLVAATAGALGAGALLGGITLVIVRTLMRMPTDATPRIADLSGAQGTVVTRIPADGLGEISLVAGGQRLKLSARADRPLAAGTPVIVVEAISPTLVIVTESELL